VQFEGFGKPLRNPVRMARRDQQLVKVKAI
jgi:hypothetical protein